MAEYEQERPVIIIGAPRSGTRMLRRVIESHREFVGSPHDMNFIWKYGNYHIPHDELTEKDLDERISRFIRAFFNKFRKGKKGIRVVEKTVSNCIRVKFVSAVYPSAQLIHLIRDGRDQAASVRRKFHEPPSSNRIFGKMRYFPLAAYPSYGKEYLLNNIRRVLGVSKTVGQYGVRMKGHERIMGNHKLLDTCGIIWAYCVTKALQDLENLKGVDYLTVRYEKFVENPLEETDRIFTFLHSKILPETEKYIDQNISASNVKKYTKEIDPNELPSLIEQIGPTLHKLGYTMNEN